MYTAFFRHDVRRDKSLLWKLKIPLRIKIFLVVFKEGVTLTKDN
jgi:hypothetical protein